jgi:hypothetical protein
MKGSRRDEPSDSSAGNRGEDAVNIPDPLKVPEEPIAEKLKVSAWAAAEIARHREEPVKIEGTCSA